jgi:hypothetical protein
MRMVETVNTIDSIRIRVYHHFENLWVRIMVQDGLLESWHYHSPLMLYVAFGHDDLARSLSIYTDHFLSLVL